MGLVQDSLLQAELVESADSLSSRLVEVLGHFGDPASFDQAVANSGIVSFESIGQLARRVGRLEEILETYREGAPPDRRGFDALQRRLADHGIEDETTGEDEADAAIGREDEGEEEA
jgi:hypothetical protein